MDDAIVGPQQENEAKVLFLRGVEFEREGNHFEAIQCYKKALKLDPDVEKKTDNKDDAIYMDTYDQSEDEYVNNEDLFLRFQRIMGTAICFPKKESRRTHFSVLPPELVIYIFRWVVSSDLDLYTLEQCAGVCRGWYMCARDPELWRRACSKFWTSNVNDLVQFDDNWRRMYLERPHVVTIGVYIAKISYVRYGEQSFRDNSNGPLSYIVEYYRYLRFFSDGRVLMARSTNPPARVVHELQSVESAPDDMCSGSYRLFGNRLFLKLFSKVSNESPDRKYIYNKPKMTTYNMVLEISNHKRRPSRKLKFIDYSISYVNKAKKQMVTRYDVTTSRFPPFIFSRVKSYSNESHQIL